MSDFIRHADYPHLFGSLYDCPACESRCYCRPDETQCVHCAIVDEISGLSDKAIRYINRFTY